MSSQQKVRFDSLDGLRGLAAIAIILHHAGFQSGATFDGSFGRVLGRLDVGVPVFFALSGFLLFRPIAESVIHDKPLRPALEHLWRRAVRIYPAFWVALTAIIIFTSETFESTVGGVVTVLLIHIHTPSHALGPMPQAWSLATEVSFYLFLPLLARVLRPWLAGRELGERRNALFATLAAGSLASLGFRTLSLGLDNGWTSASLHWLPATFDYFAVGMALAVASVSFVPGTVGRDQVERWAAPAGRWWLAAGGLLVVVSQWIGLELGLDRASWEREIVRQLLYAAIAACLLFPLVFGQDSTSIVRRVLRSGPFVWIGSISYSIYLWHLVFVVHPLGPMETLVGELELFDRRFWPLVIAATLPTLFVSWLSYRFVEQAGQRAKTWVRRPAVDPTPTETLVARALTAWRVASFRAQVSVIAAAGLALRVGYVLVAKRDQTLNAGDIMPGDQYFYSLAADALARGDGFVVPWHHVSVGLGLADITSEAPHAADHPPLTAIAMAPASLLPGGRGDHVLEQRLLMCIFGAVVIVVVGLLGRAIAGRAVGMIAALLAAVHPGFWINDALIMSETLTTLCVAALVWSAVVHRRNPTLRSALTMGALVGVAGLARAEALLLGVFLVAPTVAVTRALVRVRLAHLLAATSMSLLVLAPWVIPNLVRFDRPVIMSTNDGLTLVGANSPETYEGGGIGFWTLEYQQSLSESIPALNGADQSVVSHIWRNEGVAYIRENLKDQPRVMLARLGRQWSLFRPLQTIDFNTGEGREIWASNLALIGLYSLVPLAVVGFLQMSRSPSLRETRWPLVALLIHVSLIAIAVYGNPRFRVPAEVALVIWAAIAIAHFLRRDSCDNDAAEAS